MPDSNSLIENHWQTEQLVANGEHYFDALCDDIAEAQTSVFLEAYIFKLDTVGERVCTALKQAAQRGVIVKVLIDGFGSMADATKIAHDLNDSDVVVKIYHPPPWYLRSYRWSLERGNVLRKLLYFLLAINRRNHRKLAIIDNNLAWVGSFNISSTHLSEQTGGENWRDYAVRITGSAVQRLSDNFHMVWEKRRALPTKGFLTHYLSNLSPYSRRLKRRFLLRRIAKATDQLWICSAYFAPYGGLVRAIKRACHRGVDVRLIVPSRSDVVLFPALTASYYSDLLKHGVKVFEYQKAFMHAKVLLIDQQIIVGSTNLNNRSFFHDLELDVLLDQKETLEELKGHILEDFNHSREVTLTELPRYRKLLLLSWLPRLIRYWM
jgi:cardiolipin synthase